MIRKTDRYRRTPAAGLLGAELSDGRHHEEIRRFAILGANASGQAAKWKAFADQCMAEYDLNSWTVPDLVTRTMSVC